MKKNTLEQLDQIVFYSLERAIKSYRQFAQKNINKFGIDLTIDQWLILTTIHNNPDITQQQMAEIVFKDLASITRIIELLVQKEILSRASHPGDRRRYILSVTQKGISLFNEIAPIIKANRKQALQDITPDEIQTLKSLLNRIAENCR